MNTKNRLIEKLLKVAKKHKVLTYPVLALVAVISAVSNLFSWGTGAGKRIVAIIMVMVMIVSQSYFLTSSASENEDTEETELVQMELQEEADSGEADEGKSESPLVETETESDSSDSEGKALVETEEPKTEAAAETVEEDADIIETDSINNGSNDQQVSEQAYAVTDQSIDAAGDGSTQTSEEIIETDEIDSKTDVTPGSDEDYYYAKVTIHYGNGSTDSVISYSNPDNNSSYHGLNMMKSNEKISDNPETFTYDVSDFYTTSLNNLNIANDGQYNPGHCYSYGDVLYADSSYSTQVSSTQAASLTADSEGNIDLYAKKELVRYNVTIIPGDDQDDAASFAASYISEETAKNTDNNVTTFVVDKDTESGVATITLTGIKRHGYLLTGITVNNGGTVSSNIEAGGIDEGEATISISGDSQTYDVTFSWIGKPYNLYYYMNADDTEPTHTEPTTYGSDITLTNAEIVLSKFEKVGYTFSGKWTIQGSDYNKGTAVSTLPYSIRKALFDGSDTKAVKIIANYNYNGIVLEDESKSVITFEYKLAGSSDSPILISAKYKDGKASWTPNFKYEITDTNSITELGDPLTYNTHLTVVENKGFSIYTDGPLLTNEDGYDKAVMKVTDLAYPDENEAVATFPILIKINKRQVTISKPDTGTAKEYDGDTTVSNKFPINDLKTNYTDITAKCDSAEYDLADAGNRKIYLNNCSLNLPAEEIINYTIVKDTDDATKVSVEGKITPRKINIKTTYKLDDRSKNYYSDKVRAGEANPVMDVEEDRSDYDTDLDNEGILAVDSFDQIKETYNIKGTTSRVDNSEDTPSEGYDVDSTVGVGAEIGNYKISKCNKANFKVIQESPEGKYTINATQGDNGYSKGESAYIEADTTTGYDTVHIYRSAAEPDVSGKTVAITEDDTHNKNLKIWLTDSVTGAITSQGNLVVNYDMTAPIFVSYSLEEVDYTSTKLPSTYEPGAPGYDQGAPGLYFPNKGSVLDFGTYIKSEINIVVRYSDATSGVATLHYGLFSDKTQDKVTNFTEDPNEPGTYVATIRVLHDAADGITGVGDDVGLIKCYAKDKAGNSSQTVEIKKLAPEGTVGDYEWSVETAGPELGTLMVYAGGTWGDNGDTEDKTIVADQSDKADSEMKYYNHCNAQLNAKDELSGIERIVWHINGEDTEEKVRDLIKIKDRTFYKKLDFEGKCIISATVYDNAGNKTDKESITFMIDNVAPTVTLKYKDDEYISDPYIFLFSAYDNKGGSGIDTAMVYKDGIPITCDLLNPTADGVYDAYFDARKNRDIEDSELLKGDFDIVVTDKAGNVTSVPFTISKISNEVPPCPTFEYSPAVPKDHDGWYNSSTSDLTVRINTHRDEFDAAPLIAKYDLWKSEKGYTYTSIEGDYVDVPIVGEGIFSLQAWTESESHSSKDRTKHVQCENYDSHLETIKVDRTAPDIKVTTEKGSGTSIIVKFTVTDVLSGVDESSVSVIHDNKKVEFVKDSTSGAFVGSFTISETGDYTIKASDIAGNVSDEEAFTPMSMKVKAVSNITQDGATIAANIIKGSFDIKSAVISYKKYADSDFKEAETVTKTTDNGDRAVSTVLKGLDPDTTYTYKVTASSTGNEVLEGEGYFKTLSTDQTGVSVIGTARYSPEADGYINVGIYKGNVCVMAQDIEAGDEFGFANVPDGNYNIVATDGTYSKSMRLLIEDNMIIYPTQYIDLVLSGMNTSVEITTDSTPNITADDMDTIFTSDTYNYDEADKKLIAEGGTIEFRLYATLKTVSTVSSDEISAMYAVTDSNKIVGAYLDLSLYKIRKDKNGNNVGESPSRVTNLSGSAHISVTIPLGDLAGKPDLEVVRIHNDGENFIGASLSDTDSNPSTYTITTDQFSTYAVLYSKGTEENTSEEAVQPTTESTEQQDNVVVVPGSQTTVGQTVQQPSTQAATKVTVSDDEDVKEIKSKTKKAKASGSASVGTLTSSGTAKTGDASPINIMIMFMLLSACAVIVLRKRMKHIDQ